ncbi:MAG TPA: hypothetical protein DCQ06_05235 [Myxococcales bacterium]|nr:hypothetical protein [Myxococcales bacterium]HAN30981.1 hypothetical protein [Myxococcales bacterium]
MKRATHTTVQISRLQAKLSRQVKHLSIRLGLWLIVLLCACSAPSASDPIDQADQQALSDVAGADSQGPAPLRVQRIKLGEHSTDATGKSPKVVFDLPADVTAIVVHVDGPDEFHYTLAALTRDAGFAMIPQAWLDQTSLPDACVGPCQNRIVAQRGYAAFLFPNTPLIELRPGLHQIRVYAFDDARKPVATQVEIGVDFVRSTEVSTTLKLPMNLCFTGAKGWNAVNSVDQQRLQQAIDFAQTILSAANIEFGPIRRFDVDPQGQYIATQKPVDSDLAKLFESGAGLPKAINVFFTDRIIAAGAPPGANVALGVAGGIPGPPNEVGHIRAGVALSLHIPQGQPDLLGVTLVHEVSHYLGLFHSSEPGPNGAHDTLVDTAEDDPKNLMYWSLSEQSLQLSHEQIQVLRRSPWLVAP